MTIDPDSPEMGMWVDRWLASLRQAGAKGPELQQLAKRLARACDGRDEDEEVVVAFEQFVASQLTMN